MQTVTLTGFKEFEAALRALPKATGKNVLKRVAKDALEPMAQIASQRAPHRTGQLAFSIIVSDKRTRRAKSRFKSSSGIEMAMGPAGGFGRALLYAAFDEFGTVDTPAFGYMRSAWDGGSQQALERVKTMLGAEIEKSAKKHAVKIGKAVS